MLHRFLFTIATILLPILAQAQTKPPPACGLGGCTMHGTINAPTVNATGSTAYEVLGAQVLNTYANQTSPITTPEGEPPAPGAIYLPGPVVIGYANTAGSTTNYYASQLTDNFTVTGTTTKHWGEFIGSINLIGTGTFNAELNYEKTNIFVPTGMTVASGENLELSIQNTGTLTTWAGLLINPINEAGGVMSSQFGIKIIPTNNNSSTSIASYSAIQCGSVAGAGTIATGQDACIFNTDNNATITNAGHYGARPTGSAPVLTSCGSGSPALNSRASDVIGTVTEGTSATGCVITFNIPYPFTAPQCVISSPNAATYTSYSVSETAITIVNSNTSGNEYSYMCIAGY